MNVYTYAKLSEIASNIFAKLFLTYCFIIPAFLLLIVALKWMFLVFGLKSTADFFEKIKQYIALIYKTTIAHRIVIICLLLFVGGVITNNLIIYKIHPEWRQIIDSLVLQKLGL